MRLAHRMVADCARIEDPLFFHNVEMPNKNLIRARDLQFSPCSKHHAVILVRAWHSRLPNTQNGPWMLAFAAKISDVTYAVALWNNPSARMLPNDWLELRRMASAPDAPFNTASRFLGYMARWIRANRPAVKKLISYQDAEVHNGTIYKAANWSVGHIAKPRSRDRTLERIGTKRKYRQSINGAAADGSQKIRWELDI